MPAKVSKKHGGSCWLRWPRWRRRDDSVTHQTVYVCTKCGYAKFGLGTGVEKLGGGLGPGG